MTADPELSGNTTTFRSKVVTSAKLAGIRFASNLGLRLVSTIVLTRLLAPEIYGVFAIVLVYLYLLEMISDIGIRSLILTKEGHVSDSFLRTCWTVAILRGLAIALFSIVIAAVIFVMQQQNLFSADNPYSADALPWAIAALGGASFIAGFKSPMVYMRERDMDFVKVTVVFVINNVFGLIMTIVLAYYLRSVWALVFGSLARSVLSLTLSFLMFKGPAMRLHLSRDDISIVIGRGKWIMGHSVLSALTQSADRLVLGFVMTSTTFGFYFIARQLVDLMVQFLASVNGQIGLQVFTHLQKSTSAEFRRNYYRYRLFFDALAGLGAGGLMVLAPLLVQIVFDDRYAGVAPIIQTLIWGILLIGPTLLRSAFSAERRFKEMTFMSFLTAASLWIGLGIAIFVFDSVEGALIVVALHRLPEAMALTVLGGDRDWVVIWREFISFFFCGVGAGLGLAVLALWNILV